MSNKIVLKFGGSSLSSNNGLKTLSDIVKGFLEQQTKPYLVVSALEGSTTELLKMSKLGAKGDKAYLNVLESFELYHSQIVDSFIKGKNSALLNKQIKEAISSLEQLLHGVFLVKDISVKTQDHILGFGEQLSALIVAEYLKQKKIDAKVIDSRQLMITDRNFGIASIQFEPTIRKIKESLDSFSAIPVITGFIASTDDGQATTRGRGGSDYTAAIIAAAIGAVEIQLWTDVDGFMTADPRKVKRALTIDNLSYEEAMELCHFGARVIFPPTMQPALDANIPLRIKNTLRSSAEGSLISALPPPKTTLVTGISSISNVSLLRLQGSGMTGIVGVSNRLFDALSRERIRVILISQASSEHSICFAIDPTATFLAKRAIEEEFALEIQARKIEQVLVEENFSVIAVVGANMHNTPGISAKVFQSLGKNGINVRAIAQGSSELNISVVIKQSDEAKALNALHDAFFLSDLKTVNLFLMGTGNVGGKLLEQISGNTIFFRERLLELKIVGLANYFKMLIDQDGVLLQKTPQDYDRQLDKKGTDTNLREFINKMKSLNLPNSIFIDCTASEEIANCYLEILSSSISVITPNKRANSGKYETYKKLKEQAAKANVKFYYETNVGAGLPVINTLNDLIASGDEILKIEAVLSGTLSYIFNSFTPDRQFSEVVKEAKEKGYTEPDPRDDLYGTDVARKLLILAREIGIPLELCDVDVQSLVPECCVNAKTVDDFFTKLKEADKTFAKQIEEASSKNQKLRYIGVIENSKAKVRLSKVDINHPFYGLSGSDNIISFTTKRYLERPLVVKGPGAGNAVTAAGVLADIMRAASYLT